MPRLFLPALCLVVAASAVAGPFDSPQVAVIPAPAAATELPVTGKVIDLDCSLAGPEVAALVQNGPAKHSVLFWRVGEKPVVFDLPRGVVPRSVAWHPAARVVFLSAQLGGKCALDSLTWDGKTWALKTIYKSAQGIGRILVGPRPFNIGFDEKTNASIATYRIFFERREKNGSSSLRSVTIAGDREYQVAGSKGGFTKLNGQEFPASVLEATTAVPATFHPSGLTLVYRGENAVFHSAVYGGDHWVSSAPLPSVELKGGSLMATPNGLSLLHWIQGQPGLTRVSFAGKETTAVAAEHQFLLCPTVVPDGRGVIGVEKGGPGSVLRYVPVQDPMGDVVNAWMFAPTAAERDFLLAHGGALRNLGADQLFSVYESENYGEGSDDKRPMRPYLVTTDVFWEIFAAAYEGLFIIRERTVAIPEFWKMVDSAGTYFSKAKPGGKWAGVFAALAAAQKGTPGNAEAALILKAEGKVTSPVLGEPFDYSELKPRGHYTASPASALYFKAFKYLTFLKMDQGMIAELQGTGPEVRTPAASWLASYEPYIAPARGPVVWDQGAFTAPVFARHPMKDPRIFPLSWGFDNETLLSTVNHPDWPTADWITGPGGARVLPSGLDLAAATGSGLARELLAKDISAYPPLGPKLIELAGRFDLANEGKATNLYSRWLAALAVQWADLAGAEANSLWKTKRLQTGLASWATLRHATVLVNERTVAEAGEGGFEALVPQPPRGAVEGDPKAFNAIGDLFDALAATLSVSAPYLQGTMATDGAGQPERLAEVVTKRLAESATKCRLFGSLAAKQLAKEPFTNAEYEEILYVARLAEHHFLVYKSLANEHLALSNPDPMPKVVDVAGGGQVPFLLSGVGRPMEWDSFVPFFGRRQLVKGAVYSYYERSSPTVMNDKEWLEKLPTENHPAWIADFISKTEMPAQATTPY